MSRPSTSCLLNRSEDVDARIRGHDGCDLMPGECALIDALIIVTEWVTALRPLLRLPIF
jgi:hypothetical protein